MPVQKVNIEEYIQLSKHHPIIDVRSEGEYAHAHIPGAYSLPLFNNEERKIVGTAYKQQSRQVAIKLGLEIFGKKMVKMVEDVEGLTSNNGKITSGQFSSNNNSANGQPSPSPKIVLVHCWRGGMRSAGIAWLLDLYGFKVYTLNGGYKLFRNWVLKQFDKPYQFKILGGFTGSGKTEVIKRLAATGESVVDLEGLAHHKGSAFGAIGEQPQPSQEMFENKLAVNLYNNYPVRSLEEQHHAYAFTEAQPFMWLEDESQRIGNVNIPHPVWKIMRQSPMFFLDIPFDERLDHIIEGYGKFEKEKLVNAVIRIKKRLGGLETKNAINHLLEDEVTDSFRILLSYYDKLYLKGMQSRENPNELITKVECDTVDAEANTKKLLNLYKKVYERRG